MSRDPSDSVQFKVRIREATRAALEDAARDRQQTLNREIVERLERSLSKEEEFGGRQTAAMLRMIAATVRVIEEMSGKDWTTDYATWLTVREAMMHATSYYDPRLSDRRGDPGSDAVQERAIEAMRREAAAMAKSLGLPTEQIDTLAAPRKRGDGNGD